MTIRYTAGPQLSCKEHPPDSWRVRAVASSGCRAYGHPRSDREEHSAGVRGSAGVPRARARRGRQRPVAKRSVLQRKAGRAIGPGRRRVRRRGASACRSIAPAHRARERGFRVARSGIHRGVRRRSSDLRQAQPIERAILASSSRTCCRAKRELIAQERVQGEVSGVRLAAERSDGAAGLTSEPE